MAIIRRRLPMPLLLLLFVLLWLALDPSEAGRVPSDRVLFPTGPNAAETGPKPWDLGPEMNPRSSTLRNGTKSNQVQPGSEIKSRAGLPVNANETQVEPPRTDITASAKIPVSKNPTEETPSPPVPRNATRSISEDKMIAFLTDTKIDGNRTELTMAPKGSVLIGPRITLESVRICPEGFTLSNEHCRKSA